MGGSEKVLSAAQAHIFFRQTELSGDLLRGFTLVDSCQGLGEKIVQRISVIFQSFLNRLMPDDGLRMSGQQTLCRIGAEYIKTVDPCWSGEQNCLKSFKNV